MTPADLERIEALLAAAPAQRIDPDIWRSLEPEGFTSTDREFLVSLALAAPRLIALARRALELESALAFLEMSSTSEVLGAARACGWPGLQSEGGKEQGEHG